MRIKLDLLVAYVYIQYKLLISKIIVKHLCIISSISNNGINDIYLATLPSVNFLQ